MTDLRLASYNIRKCLGTDRARSPGRVVEVLNGLSADIVALQEADHRLGARPAALPRAMIAHETDYRPVVPDEGGVSLGWHGNAVLLREGVEPAAVTALDLPGLEPRGALIVEAETSLGPLRVVAVHLGLIRRHRLRQLAAIRAALAHRREMPTAILGDFNEWSPMGGMEPLAGAFEVHSPGRSFHSRRPVAGLDRIALSQALDLHDAGVHETPLSRTASDHLPVWADVRRKPAADG